MGKHCAFYRVLRIYEYPRLNSPLPKKTAWVLPKPSPYTSACSNMEKTAPGNSPMVAITRLRPGSRVVM